MASPAFVSYLTCLLMWKMARTTWSSSVRPGSSFVSADVGDSITLQCLYSGKEVSRFSWYKQTLSQKLRLITTVYMYQNYVTTLYGEFENSTRFTLETKPGQIGLKISDLDLSDSATYYCASLLSLVFEFLDVITVEVKGSGLSLPVLVRLSASETSSAPLSCTLQTGTCDGDNSVYWFKNSEESLLGHVYTRGGRSNWCERKPDTETHSCVYNLPQENQRLSHAGRYDCAVASCGQLLFRKEDMLDSDGTPVLVYFLSGALAFTTILKVFLAVLLYHLWRRASCQCGASHMRPPVAPTTNVENYTNEENLHYAALSLEKARRSRRHRRNGEDECVYSVVKQ